MSAYERELTQCSYEVIAHTTVYDIQVDIQGVQKAVIQVVHNYTGRYSRAHTVIRRIITRSSHIIAHCYFRPKNVRN